MVIGELGKERGIFDHWSVRTFKGLGGGFCLSEEGAIALGYRG